MTIIFSQNCTNFKLNDISYNVKTNPLEYKNDSIKIIIEYSYPTKLCPNKGEVIIAPYLVYEGGNLELKPMTLRTPSAASKVGEIIKPEGGKLVYQDIIRYQPQLERSQLKFKATAIIKGQVKKNINPDLVLAYGVITTPLMAEKESYFIEAPHKYGPVTKVHSTLIYFPFNSSEIRKMEREGPDMEGFRGFVERYAREGATFKKMDIQGFASPEGPDDVNLTLSSERAEALSQIVISELNKINNPAVREKSKIKKEGKGKDITGFNKKLEQKNIIEKDKLKSLVEKGLNRIELRENLQKISPVLDNELEIELFSPLRRAEVLTTIELKPRSDEELIKLSEFNPSGLTLEEGHYLCQKLISDNLIKIKVMKALQKKHVEEWRLFNNEGVYHAETGSLNEAEEAFRMAEKIKPNESTILTNLGMLFLKKGNEIKAKEYFKMAQTTEAKMALVPDLLKEGNYKDAVSVLGDIPSFNSALAQLLSGNVDQCLKILEAATNKDEFKISYLKAISYARLKNVSALIPELNKLLTNTPTKDRKKILTDPEFMEFWNHSQYPKK